MSATVPPGEDRADAAVPGHTSQPVDQAGEPAVEPASAGEDVVDLTVEPATVAAPGLRAVSPAAVPPSAASSVPPAATPTTPAATPHAAPASPAEPVVSPPPVHSLSETDSETETEAEAPHEPGSQPEPAAPAQPEPKAKAPAKPAAPTEPADPSSDSRSRAATLTSASVVRPLPRVISVSNQKGGVGKTTTTVNLGAGLAELGYRVLVIDLDPQGNASTGLGIAPRGLEVSMYDVLLDEVPLKECIQPTETPLLSVAPANLDLAGAEIELVPAFSRELRLRNAVDAVRDDFDYVLIDCPPSLGLLTVNALACATEVLVPIQCEYYALEGLGQLLRNVELVQKNLNRSLEVSTIVLVMYDARTKLSDQVAQDVRDHFGDRVCRMMIPRNVRLSEAPSYGQPALSFDAMSRGAIAYRELAKEVSGGPIDRTG